MGMWVCERKSERVRMWERESESVIESVCVGERVKERESMCV